MTRRPFNLEKMADEVEGNQSKKARTEHGGPPPVYTSLEELAGSSRANQTRYASLVQAFQAKYDSKPAYLTRAPGRVNIIGEHVDYSGYGVLPMAIEQDIVIACGPNPTSRQLRFSNIDSDLYPDHTCPMAAEGEGGLQIDKKGVAWYSYLLCGIKGVLEEMGIREPVGVDILVDGSIPPASGLSSSSALVCCAALTALCANGRADDLPAKRVLAEMCARSERFVGTQGGGMDQAISFLGQEGKAMMIQFDPVRPSEVRLPRGYSFVVSNTLVESKKAMDSFFNTRVAECHLAARVIAKEKGLEDWRRVTRLKALQDALGLDLSEMPGIVTDTLHPEAYSREEACQLLGLTDEEFASECLTEKSRGVTSFKLHDRARHVYEEAWRVHQFYSTANSGDDDSNDKTAVKLGVLMDQSHASCSHLYQCSCSELDRLVALGKEEGGALGARLTGAGWGGCVVSLVREEEVPAYLEKLREGYYAKEERLLARVDASLFATRPGAGAAVCRFQE